MKFKLFLIFIISIIIIVQIISAADFVIESTTTINTNPYKGDLVQFKGVIRADFGNYCGITCQYNVGSFSGYVSISGNSPGSTIYAGNTQEFPFSIRAEAGENGVVSQNLVITCNRVPNYVNCWPETSSRSELVYLYYFYSGDNKCTTSKEKCTSYQNFIGTNDCSCSFTSECRPDGDRTNDERGCQTFCSNGVYEPDFEDCTCSSDFSCSSDKKCNLENGRAKDSDNCVSFCGNSLCEREYENCTSCSQDCKKCDLMPCQKRSECSNNYCTWGVCWHDYFRTSDGHCDSDYNENCANSPIDCKCEANQRCNSAGYCEYYCGNLICEESERGVCKADCNWCGDLTCQTNENCASCPDDCGNCRTDSTIVNNTVVNTTVTIIEENYTIVTIENSTYENNSPNNFYDNPSQTNNNDIEDNPSIVNKTEDIPEINTKQNINNTKKTLNSKYAFNKTFFKDNYKEIIIVAIGIITIIVLIIILIKKETKPKKRKNEEESE